MKTRVFLILIIVLSWAGCVDYPIDEDGLLVTERAECYVGSFELLGSDQHSVLNSVTVDTLEQKINAEVFYGTDLKNLYPQFSLVTDAKLDPKIVGKVDFSDLANPKQYTVVSGNRKVRKLYTIYITVQQKR